MKDTVCTISELAVLDSDSDTCVWIDPYEYYGLLIENGYKKRQAVEKATHFLNRRMIHYYINKAGKMREWAKINDASRSNYLRLHKSYLASAKLERSFAPRLPR